ncbi:MAG: HAD-IC family P-type ATPase [Candidatus Nealsonbacteria bacterium]|nr:HAD-IC family P-type ATPase [Candidatus Nealsonbacteria bacterium]
MKFSQYTTKTVEEVFKKLNTGEEGISDRDASDLQEKYGLNETKTKEISLFDIFLRQFKSPFFYLLLIAALVAFLIGEEIDSLVIFVFIFINVSLGFFQEAKAIKTAALLKQYISLRVRIRRGGKEKTVEQKFLTQGDIVLLEAGNIVPADLRIIKVEKFLIDESVLSGESVPVSKIALPLSQEAKEIFEAKNIIFAGTSVISGKAEAIVIAIGKDSFFGEVTKLTSEIPRESSYGKNLFYLSKIILNIVTGTVVVLFILNLIIKGTSNFLEFLIFCIALIVSIIPEALPVVVTFALSQGALRLTKQRVVVKRLSAIEDLGSIDILCSDKTGTLTENKLFLEEVFSQDKEKCLLFGLLSSAYVKEEIESIENPFDLALMGKATLRIKESLSKFKAISEIPFDPSRLRNGTLMECGKNRKILIIRGAAEVILANCSRFGEKNIAQIKEEIEKIGKGGKRVLAVAFKEIEKSEITEEDEKDLEFMGYFSFVDPLKKTAKEVVCLSGKLGLKIKILTGDSKEVAGYVAKEVGLIEDTDDVILGEDLLSLPQEKFEQACEKFSVFARVSPQTKFKIIQALQKKFEVGFLGEGINDAPALKIANVAIAVKEGADISREVSDIILLEKDLRTIVNGIKEGRSIFSNINKYIKCTLASNFGNFYSIAAISLFIPFLPMLPIQILLVNLLSDFPLIAVTTDSVDVRELKNPKQYQLQGVIVLIISLALVSTVFDFIFFGIFHNITPSLLQSLWFIESILTEILLIFSIRTSKFFLKSKRPSFPLLILSALTILVTVSLPFTKIGKEFFHFASPSTPQLLIVFSLLASYLIISEAVKLFYFRHWKNKAVKA